MQTKNRNGIQLAEAIVQTLWLKGLITREERERIKRYSQDRLQAN